jgi:hypothetical protein
LFQQCRATSDARGSLGDAGHLDRAPPPFRAATDRGGADRYRSCWSRASCRQFHLSLIPAPRFTTLADLKGKKIGIAAGPTGHSHRPRGTQPGRSRRRVNVLSLAVPCAQAVLRLNVWLAALSGIGNSGDCTCRALQGGGHEINFVSYRRACRNCMVVKRLRTDSVQSAIHRAAP